jgi:hypothetical protein
MKSLLQDNQITNLECTAKLKCGIVGSLRKHGSLGRWPLIRGSEHDHAHFVYTSLAGVTLFLFFLLTT